MSRALSLISPTTGYVSPGQLVTAQLATNVGFNVNDYVYSYGNNQIGNLGSTIGVGLNSTYIAGLKVNGFVQTGFTPTAVMSGPFTATATYTGTTRTRGAIFQAFTNFTANSSNSNVKSCVLNNGNIAAVFRETTDLKLAIFTNAGVSVKAATTIASTSSAGSTTNALGISAMTDGGFVVCFTDASNSKYMRFDSAGTTTVSATNLESSLATPQNFLSIAAGSNGGFAVAGNNSNAQLAVSSYSSLNVHQGQISSSMGGSTGNSSNNAIVGLSNGNFAVGYIETNNTRFLIITPSLSIVVSDTSITSALNEPFNMAAYDSGFIVSNRNPSNNQGRVCSVSNSGIIFSTGTTNNVTSTVVNVCVGAENNTAYMVFLNNTTGFWTLCTFTSINSTSIALASTDTITGFSPNNYFQNNLSNAQNGAVYFAAFNAGKPAFITINQATYTQNTTTLTNLNLYTPTNGFYFLGIGATTAAAGTAGLIYTNGGISLPATYPSVSTGYAFDYQSNSFWAQRGNINGRTINLQGAQ